MIILKDTQEKILSAFQSVAGVVERRNTLPILANVMLNKTDQQIQLTTSDLEIQIQTVVSLGGDSTNFSTTVAARKLIDILRSIPAEQMITLESNDDRFILKSGKSRFTLQTLPAQDFPLVQKASDFSPKFVIQQKVLKKLFNSVHFAMAVNDIRYYLNGILFVVEGKNLILVATDGHRLALDRAELDVELPQQQVILPRKTVLELQRLLNNNDDGQIEIQFASNQAKFDFENLKFVTKLVDGKFPDYTRVIPSGYNNHVELERTQLLSCLQRAAIMTSDKFKGVRLTFEPDVLRIAAHNAEQEEAVEELDIEYKGVTVDIGFNISYLIDALSNIAQKKIRLSFADANSSVLITLPDDNDFIYVVMPMRI
ncbi:MAG: DNA polymerase III subunit beta [Saezia sp.]